jgi:hypothetical protein
MRANSGPPRGQGRGGRQGEGGGAQGRGADAAAPAPAEGRQGAAGGGGDTNSAFGGGRGGVQLEPPTDAFPFDPKGPPVATFFEAGGNIEGGLPYTDWAREIRKQRFEVDKAKDNPDANCMPMGFLQFHQQPQPRKIMNISNPKSLLVEWEANYGLWHIYLDGRKLPPQGEPQPWWYGYSVGRWEDDYTFVVNTIGTDERTWLDNSGNPHSADLKVEERYHRVSRDLMELTVTLDDPKAYARPWTPRNRMSLTLAPVNFDMMEMICSPTEVMDFRKNINDRTNNK